MYFRRKCQFSSIDSIEKNVPDKNVTGTIKKLDMELCTSHVKDKKPIIAPNEENIITETIR